MTVNFTPSLEPYKATGSFRFWCQKVLPLVYDDSLSYYELLCKVVNYLNDVISNVDGLKVDIDNLLKAYNELQDYVNNYFDNLDVQEEINNKLDSMVEDGTLDNIINKKLFGELNEKIESIKEWSQPGEYYEMYRKEVLKNTASYLMYEYGSSCVKNNTVPNNLKVCWVYDTNKGYMSLFGRYLEFVYSDRQSTADGSLPVAYADCAVFTSLLNKCINYIDSPYYYAFNTTPVDKKILYRKSFETGTIESKPYTYDMLNNYNTETMAYIHEKTGIGLTLISEMNSGDLSPTLTNIDRLETGDMIYRGVSGNSVFHGIDHCGTFIKTLDELNNADGVPNGVTFNAVNNKTSDVGYVVEFAGSLGDNNYTDCLRITAIEDWFAYKIAEHSWVRVYASKPVSCILTSNKAYSELTSKVLCYDMVLTVAQERDENGGYFVSEIDTTIPGGWILKANEDLNDYTYNGIFRVNTSAIYETLKNKPENNGFKNMTLVCTGFNKNITHGYQICYGTSSSAYQYICTRSLVNGNWSPWVLVNTLNSINSNEGVKGALTGLISTGAIAANTHTDITVNFTKPMVETPEILLTREVISTSTTPLPDVYACVVNNSSSTTQFTVRVTNAGSEPIAASYWRWFALNTDQN